MPLTLSGLWIYPVKSLRGIALEASDALETGLRYDRSWMVVDETGQFLTQRQIGRMATLDTAIGDALEISAPNGESVRVPLQSEGPQRTVRVWRDALEAADCGDEAATFLSDHLGLSCRLVNFSAASRRLVDANYAQGGETTHFSDGFPCLVLGQASLDDLNDRLLERGAETMEVERFRPNILVRGGNAYDEDEWGIFRVGNAEFESVKPCTRCIVTTLDPESGEKLGAEPLATLATYRRWGGSVALAQNALVLAPGRVRVGDAVEVVTRRASGIGG